MTKVGPAFIDEAAPFAPSRVSRGVRGSGGYTKWSVIRQWEKSGCGLSVQVRGEPP